MTAAVGEVDVVGGARSLITGLIRRPWGRAGPSVYETARLVTVAPWLTGHAERIEFLLGAQRPDGGWGGPDGYALVPTLSATEALLGTGHGAADRGVRALRRWLGGPRPAEIPDTPGAHLIAPALVDMVNDRLATGPARWRDTRLRLPAGMGTSALGALRAGLARGAVLPVKLLHALEVLGPAARGAAGIAPVGPGTIGASPAATAAWLPPDPADQPARRYLEEVARHGGGPVPCAAPIGVFERAWVLSWLIEAGVPVRVPPALVRALAGSLGADGTPAGDGLPPDADTTAVTLYALAGLGVHRAPDSLWAYRVDRHFCTWPGEDGRSVTVNAHVLQAFGRYARGGRDGPRRYRAAVRDTAGWLCDQQRPDGSWLDRWHASPYYATVCCALALDRFGAGPAARSAVRAAVRWVLSTQHGDGSWGWRGGTAEETAYAIMVLLATRAGAPGVAEPARRAADRGRSALLNTVAAGAPHPPLWHDKDLYAPTAIIEAALLSALHLARRS